MRAIRDPGARKETLLDESSFLANPGKLPTVFAFSRLFVTIRHKAGLNIDEVFSLFFYCSRCSARTAETIRQGLTDRVALDALRRGRLCVVSLQLGGNAAFGPHVQSKNPPGSHLLGPRPTRRFRCFLACQRGGKLREKSRSARVYSGEIIS